MGLRVPCVAVLSAQWVDGLEASRNCGKTRVLNWLGLSISGTFLFAQRGVQSGTEIKKSRERHLELGGKSVEILE